MFKNKQNDRSLKKVWFWFYLFCFGCQSGALLLSLYTHQFDPLPNADHVPYMRDILMRGVPDPASTHGPPLYAYYMTFKHLATSAFNLPYWAGKFFLDILLIFSAGWGTVQIAQVLTQNKPLSFISGMIFIATPVYIFSSAEELAVIFSQPFFLAGLLFFVKGDNGRTIKYSYFFLSGILLGISSLIRAESQFIVVVLAPYLFIKFRAQGANNLSLKFFKKIILCLGIFFSCQMMVLAPWLVAEHLSGESVNAVGDKDLYMGYYDGIVRHKGNPVSDWLRQNYELPERTLEGVINFNRHWIKKDLIGLTHLYFLKLMRIWYISDSGKWDKIILWVHAPIWLLAIAGGVIWYKKYKLDSALSLILMLVIYYWLISFVMAGLSRYMTPAYSFLGILSGVAICKILKLDFKTTDMRQ